MEMAIGRLWPFLWEIRRLERLRLALPRLRPHAARKSRPARVRPRRPASTNCCVRRSCSWRRRENTCARRGSGSSSRSSRERSLREAPPCLVPAPGQDPSSEGEETPQSWRDWPHSPEGRAPLRQTLKLPGSGKAQGVRGRKSRLGGERRRRHSVGCLVLVWGEIPSNST